jgi:hypothetical protein
VASVDDQTVEPENTSGVGIADLYRQAWRAGQDAVVRYRLAIVIEIALIAAWFLLRTAFTVESRPYLLCGCAVDVASVEAATETTR